MYPGEVIMKKVELRMNEQNKYEIIKKLVETDENKKRAATKLGCTVRTINNLSLNTRNRERRDSCMGKCSEKYRNAVILRRSKYQGNFKYDGSCPPEWR